MNFFEELGVPLKTERGNRVFPVSDKADDIADALAYEMKNLGVKIINKRVSALIIEENVCCGVIVGKEEFRSASTLIACGGKSLSQYRLNRRRIYSCGICRTHCNRA